MQRTPDEFDSTMCLIRRSLHGLERMQNNLERIKARMEVSRRSGEDAENLLGAYLDAPDRAYAKPHP